MQALARRTTHELTRLSDHGWLVEPDRVTGPSGAYVIGTEGAPPVVEPGVQPVVVLWEPFPEEVAEMAGVYFVHGDHLVDFLLAQPHLLHPDALQLYEPR